MRLYKGFLGFYAATGELSHFYVDQGESQVMINSTDVVQFSDEKKKIRYVILNFPQDLKSLKTTLKEKDYKRFIKAAKENWKVEVCKFRYEVKEF